LSLQQEAGVHPPIDVSASNTLALTDSARCHIIVCSASSELELQSEADSNDKLRSVTSVLTLTQTATVQTSGEHASSQIALTQTARNGWGIGNAISALALVQAAVGELVDRQHGVNTLTLTDLATKNVNRLRVVNSPLSIFHAVRYVLIRPDTLCNYRPFVGSSTDPNAPMPPPSTLASPLVGITAPFQLVWPADGAPVTDLVTLRAPNLGNNDRLSFTRINRETRGGTLIVFADPLWPKVQRMVVSFSGLMAQEAADVLEFMRTHLGEEIGVIDWEQKFWKGVIMTPEDAIVQDGPGCQYSASFEFEGELDPAWVAQVL
jgi:hypothetical protein